MTTSLHATRELWLENAITEFRPRFVGVGHPLPEKIHVSVGFGLGARRENAKILGQTWKAEVSEDGINHVFISPEIGDTAQVLTTLLHELIHVADDCTSGHRGTFVKLARELGFTAPMEFTPPSVELAAEMITMAETLGEYPHGRLDAARVRVPVQPAPGEKLPPKVHSGPRAQTNRYVKVTCGHCGYSVRTTRSWLARGNPRCPEGFEMEV